MRMRRATVSEEADTVFQGEGPFGLLVFLYYAGIRRRGGLSINAAIGHFRIRIQGFDDGLKRDARVFGSLSCK